MAPKIAIGLESTIDIVITFPTMEKFKKFTNHYNGRLSKHVEKAYRKISEEKGGEIPIDGKKKEAEKMKNLAKNKNAEIRSSIGGNGALETITTSKLGAKTFFTGALSKNFLEKISKQDKEPFQKVETEYAKKFQKYSPASYILQAPDTNRYILCEGEGRRIEQIRPYLKKLPDKISSLQKRHGNLDAVNLVGLQVLFGNGINKKDYQFMKKVITNIRKKTDAILFTDSGGTAGLTDKERERLCKIYLLFDILSANEDEIDTIAQTLDLDSSDRIRKMRKISQFSNHLSTIWLHTTDFQASLSTEFSEKELEKAQKRSALAGLYRVEKGSYPTWGIITDWQKNRKLSKRGKEKVKNLKNKHEQVAEDKKLVITSCYEPKEFLSTVGAGDISAAAYLYSLTR